MEKVLSNLTDTRQKILSLVESMPEEKFCSRIVPEMWSVAENLHHLTIVENHYITAMKRSAENPDPMGALRRLFQVPGWMAEIRLVKVTAPKIAEPLNPPGKAETLSNYKKTREDLKQLCQKMGESGMLALRVKHPFFGDMDGVNSVVFLGGHEVRHYKQIMETLEKAR
jgi:hypothetical protein